MFPSAVLTYRASLFRMPIFAEIKREKDAKENKYSNLNWVKNINFLFFCGDVQSMPYNEYLLRRPKLQDDYMIQAYMLKFIALLILGVT